MRHRGFSPKWLLCLAAALLLSSAAGAQEAPPPSLESTGVVAPEQAGDMLLARGQYLEAIDAYTRAPYDADTLNKMGVAWHHLSAVGQARKNYERALALRPDFPDALNNLGAVYFAEKEYGKAIRLYRRALRIAPDSPVTNVNLGTAWFAEGKPGKGMQAYRKALALDPTVFDLDSPNIVRGPMTDEERAQLDYSLAEIFASLHDPDRALSFLRKACAAGFKDSRRLLKDPAFAELRLSADFAALLGEVGLD